VLGEERQEAGVGGGVGRVGDLECGLDDLHLVLDEPVHPEDAHVGHQGGPDERLGSIAAPRQFGPSDQVGLGPGVTGAVLRVAESHQEVGALGVGPVERVGRVEGDLVVAGSLGRGEVLEGVVTGGLRPVERLLGQAGQGAVPGQLQYDVRVEGLPVLGQGTHRPLVHPGTGGRADLRVQRIGHEAVHEPHRPSHRSQIDQDPRRHGGIEGADHRRLRHVERLEQDVLRELRPEHRCCGQHREDVGAEGLHPAPDDLAEAGRHAVGRHRRRRSVEASGCTNCPAQVHPVADQLRGVQGVPGRVVTQSPGDTAQLGIIYRIAGGDDEFGQPGLVQSGQLQMTDLAPVEVGERSPQLLGHLLPGVTAAHHDQDRRVGQRPDQVAEEEEGGRLRPLEVVEDEDQRSSDRQSTQEVGGGVEGQEPFGGVVRTGRRRGCRHPGAQPGAEPRQFATDVGHMLPQQVEGCMLDARVEHRTERFERHAGLVTAAVQHGGSGRGRHGLGELGQQRRLSHPRFTAHHDAPQAGRTDQRQLRPEYLLFGGAADERHRVCQVGRQWNVQCFGWRRRLLVCVDTVPPGRHPAFCPDDLG
jgi:hypothetical protein